jgi:hypothetical protein
MHVVARINTGLGKLVRFRFLVLASFAAALVLVMAAPVAAETTEGSGWTVTEEETSGESEVGQGSSIGSGTSSTPSPPPAEEPSYTPPPEESHEEPSYSGEESYEGESSGAYESEAASTYVEPTVTETAEPKPKKPAAVSGSTAPVQAEPAAKTVDVFASPAPAGSASTDGGSVVSGTKVLLWLAAVAFGIVLVAQPRLWGRRRPPARGSGNGRPPRPIGPSTLEGARHRAPASPRPRRSSQGHP